MPEISIEKPLISGSKILDENEKIAVKSFLKDQGAFLINPKLSPARNDYVDAFDKGTVEFNPSVRNYSFHKIIIPDGAKIRDVNFSQKEPHSDVIEGENLVFDDCNLCNVEIHPSWIVNNCLTIHKKTEEIIDGDGRIFEVNSVEIDGVFVEDSRREVLKEGKDVT